MSKQKIQRKLVSFPEIKDEENKTPPISLQDFPVLKNPYVCLPIHNLVILSSLFKFGLTSSPVDVLWRSLGFVMLANVFYGYILARNISINKKKRKTDEENLLLLVISSELIALLISVPLFIILIIIGAPLASNIQETYLLSVHLSFIIFYPLLIFFKLDYNLFFKIFVLDKKYRFIFSNMVLSCSFLAIIGTWIGVIPIPLDWDRDWQKWPITLLSGAYIGSLAGSLITLVVSPL